MNARLKNLSHSVRSAMARIGGKASGRSELASAPRDPADFSPDLLDRLGRPLNLQPRELTASQNLFRTGQKLARQDRWGTLSAVIAEHDRARDTTRSGAPVAEILAAGARSDLSRALYAASEAGALSAGARMFEGIEMLDEAICDQQGDATCAAVLALTHMDAGWAWYKQGWQRGRPEQYIAQFRKSFDRATSLLEPYSPQTEDSAFLAAARCALLAGVPGAESRVVPEYEQLIDLAPEMPGHMRAYGVHLLPCWFGDLKKLELEARRTAARTTEQWGSGAYSWVYLDALIHDSGCFAMLDTEFFLEGIDDIMRRVGTQHVANLLAAYLSQMLVTTSENGPSRSQAKAFAARRDRLIREDMRETHAWVWAIMDTGYGTPGNHAFAEGDEVDSGTLQAWNAISLVLARELRLVTAGPQAAG